MPYKGQILTMFFVLVFCDIILGVILSELKFKQIKSFVWRKKVIILGLIIGVPFITFVTVFINVQNKLDPLYFYLQYQAPQYVILENMNVENFLESGKLSINKQKADELLKSSVQKLVKTHNLNRIVNVNNIQTIVISPKSIKVVADMKIKYHIFDYTEQVSSRIYTIQ